MKKRISAFLTSAICSLAVISSVYAEKSIDPSLILPEEISYTLDTLDDFLWDNDTMARTMDAFTALEYGNIVIICENNDIVEAVRAYVKEKELNEDLIAFRIESFEDMLPDGYSIETPVTNEELDTLLKTMGTLWSFLDERGYSDNSAYAALYWDKHSIECTVKSYEVEYEVKQFMQKNGINEDLICIGVVPDYDFCIVDGGQKSSNEVNTIVADEYMTLRKYLKDNSILSNIYLTSRCPEECPDNPYSCVEIYVKSEEDADRLKVYMEENYYWQDVVSVTVQPDLSSDTDSSIHNKEYIYLEGDSNDDGQFNILDAVKLQKYLLDTDTINERQRCASDLNSDGIINVFDFCYSKENLLYSR